jgi:hypothetical protein
VPAAIVVVLIIVAALVIAVPVRRLAHDGRSRTTIVAYVVLLVALAVGVTELRPLARYLLPALGVVYIVPFITWRAGLDRLLGGRRSTIRVIEVEPTAVEAPRDVTPREPETPADAMRLEREPPGDATRSEAADPAHRGDL